MRAKAELRTVLALCVILVLGGTLLSGCEASEEYQAARLQSRESHITRHVDAEAGVVCWVYEYNQGAGISCLPASDTLLDIGPGDGFASPD